MTVVYKCDECGIVNSTVISAGSSPTPNAHVYVSWKVDDDKHLCVRCLSTWFAAQALK